MKSARFINPDTAAEKGGQVSGFSLKADSVSGFSEMETRTCPGLVTAANRKGGQRVRVSVNSCPGFCPSLVSPPHPFFRRVRPPSEYYVLRSPLGYQKVVVPKGVVDYASWDTVELAADRNHSMKPPWVVRRAVYLVDYFVFRCRWQWLCDLADRYMELDPLP